MLYVCKRHRTGLTPHNKCNHRRLRRRRPYSEIVRPGSAPGVTLLRCCGVSVCETRPAASPQVYATRGGAQPRTAGSAAVPASAATSKLLRRVLRPPCRGVPAGDSVTAAAPTVASAAAAAPAANGVAPPARGPGAAKALPPTQAGEGAPKVGVAEPPGGASLSAIEVFQSGRPPGAPPSIVITLHAQGVGGGGAPRLRRERPGSEEDVAHKRGRGHTP